MKSTIVLLLVIVSIAFVSCLKEDLEKIPYKGFTPTNINDGWEISTPGNENMDSLKLDNIFREVYKDENNWMMKSFLVFRNGKLVAESYLQNENVRTEPDAIWSCTKQINAIITGIAIDKGLIDNIDDSIEKYLPLYIQKYSDKKDITIRHLLTMRSGIKFDNGTQNDLFKQHKIENSIDFILSLDLDHPPGTFHEYKDSDPHILSAIIQKVTGKPLDEFGKEVLLDPLGFKNYKWHRYSDGVTMGSWGILTTPRELSKIAQCVLNSGKYDGTQIISVSWLNEMLAIHEPNVEHDLAFGYLWWLHPSKGWYIMVGHGNQLVFIIPQKQLIVAFTSLSNLDDDCNISIDYYFDIVDRIVAITY
jgi:CubicO group peptidase (beta-lactamase class C family)